MDDQRPSSTTDAGNVPDLNEWGRILRRADRPVVQAPAEPEHQAHPSPLTDPRALGSSLLFHIVLLVVASVAALSVGIPPLSDARPAVLRGDLGPVDNRAQDNTGGGGPGELGATESIRLAADGKTTNAQALRDPEADALLSELLPAPASPDASQRALPGPLTTGLGAIPGPGAGGGGGSGGGSGGGIGRGIGPGTEFFGAREHAGSFAYVIDCSGSMAVYKSLDYAKRELLASLGHLPPDAQFAVVFYNLNATLFSDVHGKPGLMSATQDNTSRIRTLLARIVPDGGTNHMEALRTALALKPEVIFFLTDADLMTRRDADDIIAAAGTTRIQAIEFGIGPSMSDSAPLRRMSTGTGGSYRYFDVTRFGQTAR